MSLAVTSTFLLAGCVESGPVSTEISLNSEQATEDPVQTLEPEAVDEPSASRCSLISFDDDPEVEFGAAITLSHIRPADRLSSIGIVDVVVLFVDFSDVRAVDSTEDVFSVISPAAAFMDDQSNGRLTLSLAPHHKWLRMSAVSAHYGEAIYDSTRHRDWIQEAIDLADAEVDFSQAEAILVVAAPNAEKITFGPTFMGASDWALTADGNTMTNAVTSGADISYWGEMWYPHEFGHSLGLPDLYGASLPGRGGFTNPYSLMDVISSSAPGYMGYSRWILKWLEDSQVECVTADATVALTPLAVGAGSKLAVVPLSESSALVAEVRRAVGYDYALQSEGVIVYLVETNNYADYSLQASYGEGPMEVLNDARPLEPGESVTHQGVTFEVLSSKNDSDLIQITFDN